MKKPKARDRILETAARLFHERGYSEVGINEIIEKAETAKATFYQHFKSKQSLCGAWLELMHERSNARREEILAGEGSAIEKIDAYFAGLGTILQENDFRGCPYSNTGAVIDEECACLLAKIEEHKIAIRNFFRVLTGQFAHSERRANELGDALFLLYSGATVEAQNLRSLWPVEAARKTMRELCQEEASSIAP